MIHKNLRVGLTSLPPLVPGKYHTALGSVYSTKIRHSPQGKKLPHPLPSVYFPEGLNNQKYINLDKVI